MDRKKLIKLLTETALISLYHHPEDIGYIGNFSEIDEETDRENEEWIRDQLNRGNEWAWCFIEVRAEHRSLGISGASYLGCCSYLSEEEFITNSGDYYEGMKAEAIEQLADEIINKAKEIKDLERLTDQAN